MKKMILLTLVFGLMLTSMVSCFLSSEEETTTAETESVEPETTKKVVDKYDKYRDPAISQTQEETTAPQPATPTPTPPSDNLQEGFGEEFDWEDGTAVGNG